MTPDYASSTRPGRRPAPRAAAIAAATAAAGVLLVLDLSGVLDAWPAVRYWPFAVILAGMGITAGSGPRMAGIALILIGFCGSGDWFGAARWPLMILVAGAALLWNALRSRDDTPEPARLCATALFAPVSRRLSTLEFEGGEALAMWGALDVNLRRADLHGGSAVVYANALFADITLHVPEDWTVAVHGLGVLGGYSDSTHRPQPGAAAFQKCLVVKGLALFGTIDVQN